MKTYLTLLQALILLVIPIVVNVESNVGFDIYGEMVHEYQSLILFTPYNL